jgi:hypothetical protein
MLGLPVHPPMGWTSHPFALRRAPPLLEGLVRRPRTATGRENPRSVPFPIYSASEALMKPRVLPYNRPAERETNESEERNA